MVEHRVGGTEGAVAWAEFADEDAALDQVRDLLGCSDDWQEL